MLRFSPAVLRLIGLRGRSMVGRPALGRDVDGFGLFCTPSSGRTGRVEGFGLPCTPSPGLTGRAGFGYLSAGFLSDSFGSERSAPGRAVEGLVRGSERSAPGRVVAGLLGLGFGLFCTPSSGRTERGAGFGTDGEYLSAGFLSFGMIGLPPSSLETLSKAALALARAFLSSSLLFSSFLFPFIPCLLSCSFTYFLLFFS